MSQEKYLQDIREIKDMMNRSSRFMSLSGFSGISAGVVALIGAYLAYETVYAQQHYFEYRQVYLSINKIYQLLAIASGTLILALASAFFFTSRKSRKDGQKIWDQQTKRLITNLALPLVMGGVVCLQLMAQNYIGLVAPLTLVFYGLALINASKYTLGEIKSLGILECIIGMAALNWTGYGLAFWALGFGVLHIVYGIAMLIRYKS